MSVDVAATGWASSQTTQPPAAAATAGRRRAPRHLLLGLALVVGFSLAFAALALRADPAVGVLTVARPVPAGAPITAEDLTAVRVVPDAGLSVFTVADMANVVGRTAAVPLVPGSLLSPAHLGAADWPPAGESVVAVAFSTGQVPAGLVAGSRVTLLLRSTSAESPDGATAASTVAATVVQVAPADASGSLAVSLLLRSSEARQVAASGGDVALLLENPAGRG